jgi:hypothetical protein
MARFATTPVLGAMAALAALLAVVAPQYGYHRDELYFRMIPPDWGYLDQPPLTPLLAGGATELLGDGVVALRIVSLLCAVASLPIIALITREAGGSRFAQGLAAWAMAGSSMTLAFGHVLLTASLDLVVWPAALLFAMRALLRNDGRWWLAVGAVVGASTANKLLVVVLLVGLALGLAAFGPRHHWRSGWLWGGVGLAGLLALPAIAYQVSHGWPQLEIGAALGDSNADEVRVMMWLFLVLMPGPVLAIGWVVGLVGLFRRPGWKPIRALAAVVAVVVAFVYAAGAQAYYTNGVLAVLVALGAVPVAEWARTRARRIWVGVLVAVNAIGCALSSIPLMPVDWFAESGLAAVNSATADQVGWEEYVEQIARHADGADAIIASNYGEAGALDRFGMGLPPVVSGHNALWALGPPPDDAQTVLVVGGQLDRVAGYFATCVVVGELSNSSEVDNEEVGEPIALCDRPVAPWDELWPEFRHVS